MVQIGVQGSLTWVRGGSTPSESAWTTPNWCSTPLNVLEPQNVWLKESGVQGGLTWLWHVRGRLLCDTELKVQIIKTNLDKMQHPDYLYMIEKGDYPVQPPFDWGRVYRVVLHKFGVVLPIRTNLNHRLTEGTWCTGLFDMSLQWSNHRLTEGMANCYAILS